ncbi:hypothetical protein BI375_11970 [Vibrio rotiferianus]|uniref:Uncharacterized protein n=1 Tax=Vibrio rotiferianus TaxID=190895 RepID=A0ABX3D254_9VIBR|nr:hypothetical protein BI375_11970 [Vibrio rotiferianus]
MLGNWLSLITKQIRSSLNWLKVYQSKPIQIRDQIQISVNVSTKIKSQLETNIIGTIGVN